MVKDGLMCCSDRGILLICFHHTLYCC